MNNLVVSRSNFQKSLGYIKELSQKTPRKICIPTVDNDGGLFGWFEHNVTGKELNSLSLKIQEYLIINNGSVIDLFKEVGEVYKALDLLDKEYIASIVQAVKAAEKASCQAKVAAENAEKNTIDINRTIEVLKHFKADIEKLKHLYRVDDIWIENQAVRNLVGSMLTDFESVECKLNALQVECLNAKKDISYLKSDGVGFREVIDRLAHENVSLKNDFDYISAEKADIKKELENLKRFKLMLERQAYLMNIDDIWKCNKVVLKELKRSMSRMEVLSEQQYQFILESRYENKVLNNKLKVSFIVSGIALLLAIGGVVVNIFGYK